MSGTSASRTGRARVLVVDDEPALTEVLSAATEAGSAADGRSALRTARDAVEHRIDGLHNSADDHVTKPFSPEDVVLRLRGRLRRAGTGGTRADGSVRVLGDLVPARETRGVRRAGRPIRLTAEEFDLPVIHTVRGTGCTIRSAEYGR
ncbi:response regulator transcription factor [Streptomyces sp. NPDC001351]|uniref:response regulator transcription factor n=1 Tax=Streptomyces sp. NPDC001351 TaxID=3364564 RepID=UPI0036CBC981